MPWSSLPAILITALSMLLSAMSIGLFLPRANYRQGLELMRKTLDGYKEMALLEDRKQASLQEEIVSLQAHLAAKDAAIAVGALRIRDLESLTASQGLDIAALTRKVVGLEILLNRSPPH